MKQANTFEPYMFIGLTLYSSFPSWFEQYFDEVCSNDSNREWAVGNRGYEDDDRSMKRWHHWQIQKKHTKGGKIQNYDIANALKTRSLHNTFLLKYFDFSIIFANFTYRK